MEFHSFRLSSAVRMAAAMEFHSCGARKAGKIPKVYIDMDQSARKIHGHGHAVIETIIEELKNDFGTGLAHAAEYHVNATMSVCTALAYNIKNSFLDFHKIPLRQGERTKLSTFPSRCLHIPGLFSRSDNRRILRIQQAAYDPFARLQITA
jgi:hypothetical protein